MATEAGNDDASKYVKDALQLFWRASFFLLLNALLGFAVLCWIGWGKAMQPWETNAVFQGNRLDEHYDYIFSGTSRTYLMSRFEANHRAMEEGLQANILNIGLPAAGGIKPAYAYLDYCLRKGVHPKALVLCLDPFVLYGEAWNENHKFVYFEAFRPGFLYDLVKERFPWRRIFIYGRNKFTREWLFDDPAPLQRFDDVLPGVPAPENTRKRMENIYQEGVKPETFARYAPYIEKILQRCKEAGVAVHIVTLPTMLGPEPGQPAMLEYLDALHKRYDFTYDNWVNEMQRPDCYFDLDHANTRGVQELVQKFRALLQADSDAPRQAAAMETRE